ncbi:MAG: zinc ribbon domain-containing protein [Thermoflexales bacterium]|nr:zinc ribbon domain-containing protein [Thermoflexales bacterium]
MKKPKEQKEAYELMERGIAAARAERKEEAEELLRQSLALNPDSERAWLWLSAVVEGIEAQRECLQNVIRINPANPFARSGLSFLAHLREGYEYLAARAPWMAGLEDNRVPLDRLPSQQCPRCRQKNPGWAYICNRCGAPLQPVDVRRAVQREIRSTSSLARPWVGAAILDPDLAFAPEIALASPLRSILSIALGAIALTLARWMGTLLLAAFSPGGLTFHMVNLLSVKFLDDLVRLLAGALVIWLGLGILTEGIARSRGGTAPARVHYYLIAVAISGWMPIAGVLSVIGWIVPVLIPEVPQTWMLAGVGGVLFLYAVALLIQAVRTAHRLSPGREGALIGLLLLAVVALYAFLAATVPPAWREALLSVMRLIMLPMEVGG